MKRAPLIPLTVIALLIVAGGGIALRTANSTPASSSDEASEVKVTLKPLGGGAPIATAPDRPVPPRPAALATATPTAAPVPVAPASSLQIYQSQLNNPEGLDLKNGASIGPAASGVSGLSADKAYLSGSASAATGPLAIITNGPGARFTGDELTVTVWYKPEGEIKDAATLFNAFGSSLIWSKKSAAWIWRVASSASHDPKNPIAHTWYSTGGRTPATPGQWVFLALIWQRDSNTGQAFVGTTTSAVAPINSITRKEIVDGFTEPSATKRVIGNDSNKGERAFTGSVDDFRVFTKVLLPEELEKIRQADLKNLPSSL